MSQLFKSVRNEYIERFGTERMEWASRKANWHKARAQKWGLELHFSAMQWIELCDSQAWHCAYCGQNATLEPHHRHELCKGGLNAVENLDAICRACHEQIHEWPDDVSAAWLTYQNALLERFRRVALECGAVRLSCGTREENQRRDRGILLEFHPPREGKVPLRGLLPRGDWRCSEPSAAINALTQDWWDGRAGAQVQWHAGGMWEEKVFLSHLMAVEPEALSIKHPTLRISKKREVETQLAMAF